MMVSVEREIVIAGGYAISCDPSAFVFGPTGFIALAMKMTVI